LVLVELNQLWQHSCDDLEAESAPDAEATVS